MPKYNVSIVYSIPRIKEIEIEAEDYGDARRVAANILLDEDTSTWQECDEPETDIIIEAID